MMGTLQNPRGKLQDLRVTIGAAETAEVAKERRVNEEEERERRAEKELRERERRSHGEKVKLAKEIFRWCGEFCKTKEYQRLDALIEAEGVKSFCIGHGDSRCCWYLHVLDDGSLRYAPFAKGTTSKPESVLRTPEQLASVLTLEMIKEVHQKIVTGEVYEYLKRELKRHFSD